MSDTVLLEACFVFFSMIQGVLNGPIPQLESTSLSVQQSDEVREISPLQMRNIYL